MKAIRNLLSYLLLTALAIFLMAPFVWMLLISLHPSKTPIPPLNEVIPQQPAWNNNNFGYDTFTSPHRAGPMYLTNAYEFLDSPGEWYLDPGTGVLYYIPRAGQNMATVSAELPALQSLLSIGGTYAAPAHHITFSGITFTGTSWLGPSSNQGFVDQEIQPSLPDRPSLVEQINRLLPDEVYSPQSQFNRHGLLVNALEKART